MCIFLSLLTRVESARVEASLSLEDSFEVDWLGPSLVLGRSIDDADVPHAHLTTFACLVRSGDGCG